MADELKTILIKDLQEAESAADTDYIAIDNGTVTKKIRVDNYNKTANGTAKSYAESAKESADKAQRNADSVSSTVTEITNNITAAQSAAIQAEKSAEAAESATSNLQTYVNAAKESADNAKASEESTKNVADKIADSNKIAQSYAVGGTNYRTGEDTDNARYYYSGAKTAEANSETYKSNAAASESAAATSEINAKASAESATASKTAAATSEQNASNSANYARANATRAESYAIGGTSSRSGEDTDNAKYYAQQAKKSAELAAASHSVATSSSSGLMSAADKSKLDGIDPSATTTNAANIKKNADAISAETTRAKKAEEANTQLTNDLKTGLTSGTVKVAKATVADSASSLGKVSTYQTEIPDNVGRMKYLLFYDISEWISKSKDAGTYAYDGYFFSRRSRGFVSNNYTGTLSMVASYNGMSGSTPIKSDNSHSLRLRTTSEMYKPVILHNTTTNKYYLALETYGNGRDLVLFGIFQGTFLGTWIQNVGQSSTPGTLPDGYELYSEGYVSIPYERAIADKNGKDITEYLVAAAYADGAFTFTRGDGTKTTFTQQDYPVATTSADGLMSKSDKAKLDGVADQASQLAKNTAQIETAGTATNAHSVGEYVMISNALYKVAASVAKGDTWIIGTNVTAANVGSEISSLKSDLAKSFESVYTEITTGFTSPVKSGEVRISRWGKFCVVDISIDVESTLDDWKLYKICEIPQSKYTRSLGICYGLNSQRPVILQVDGTTLSLNTQGGTQATADSYQGQVAYVSN